MINYAAIAHEIGIMDCLVRFHSFPLFAKTPIVKIKVQQRYAGMLPIICLCSGLLARTDFDVTLPPFAPVKLKAGMSVLWWLERPTWLPHFRFVF